MTNRMQLASKSTVVLKLLLLALGLLCVVPLWADDDDPVPGGGAKSANEDPAATGDDTTSESGNNSQPSGKPPAASAKEGSDPRGKNDEATLGRKALPASGVGAPGSERSLPGMLGGGMGGGGFVLPGSAMPSKNNIQGKDLILAWNDERDTLWGYSDSLGKWTKLRIPKAQKRFQPTVGFSVGACQVDDRVYAYSPTTGRWGELQTTAKPIVGFGKVMVHDEKKFYIFADSTGRWSSPNDTLENDADASAVPLVDASGRTIELGDFDNNGEFDIFVPETSERMKASDLLASLKLKHDESESQSKRLAGEYRKARQRLDEKDPKLVELRVEVVGLVRETFDHRQRAQQLEAEILRHRQRDVDARLAERRRLKEQIINRRLEELINPNVSWEERENSGPAAPKRQSRTDSNRRSEAPSAF